MPADQTATSAPRIRTVGQDGEFGWLVHGAWTRAEAVAHLVAHLKARHDLAEPYEAHDFADFAYEPGWWRWIPARPDDEYRYLLHEAQPRARGAFAAVYLRRPW